MVVVGLADHELPPVKILIKDIDIYLGLLGYLFSLSVNVLLNSLEKRVLCPAPINACETISTSSEKVVAPMFSCFQTMQN